MSADQTALIRELLRFCERFLTPSGHLDNREQLNSLGVCCQRRKWQGGTRVRDGSGYRMADQTLTGTCAPSCVEFTAVLTAAREHVAANETRQLDLLGEVA